MRYRRLARAERIFYGLDPEGRVKRTWEERNDWKGGWGDQPGWKWSHESPSPELEDLTHIEFTPSEIDALDSVAPPTPPAKDYRVSVNDTCPEGFSIFGRLEQNLQAEPMQESPSSGSRQHGGPEAPTESINGVQPLPSPRPDASSSSRSTRPAVQTGESAKVSITRRGWGEKSKSPGRTRASRISHRIANVRRSARIAERARAQMGTSAPSDTVKATRQRSAEFVREAAPAPSKKPKEKKARLLTTKAARGGLRPKALKPQRISKQRGQARS